MDNRVSWNTQPERDNPTVVLLVGRVRALTAHIHKLLEVGNVLVGHVEVEEVWLVVVVVAGDGRE